MNSLESPRDSYFLETELKDILTLNSCTTLVSELIKFILYRKQQLPYTFDRLKYLITKRNAKEKQEKTHNSESISIERQFRLAEDGLTTLELIFEKTKEELGKASKGAIISEIALLFGSTPLTPKQVYRIHLPEICLAHSSVNHPERKHLVHLLRSVVLSNNLCNMLRKPMNPTNMFVFLKKIHKLNDANRLDNSINEWFIPKNRYDIPKTGQQFHIKFQNPKPCLMTCTCLDFKIYSDAEEHSQENSPEVSTEIRWYQACAIFKGFPDVYVNGVSVADLWLR